MQVNIATGSNYGNPGEFKTVWHLSVQWDRKGMCCQWKGRPVTANPPDASALAKRSITASLILSRCYPQEDVCKNEGKLHLHLDEVNGKVWKEEKEGRIV